MVEVIATNILRSFSRSDRPLWNIHIWNENGSFTFLVDFTFLYHRHDCYRLNHIYEYHGGCRIRSRKKFLPFTSTWIHPRCLVGFVLLILLFFCVVVWFCVLFVFFLCRVCPMLSVSLDCSLLHLLISLTFIYCKVEIKELILKKNKKSNEVIIPTSKKDCDFNECNHGEDHIISLTWNFMEHFNYI